MDILTVSFCGVVFGIYMVLINRSHATGAITFFAVSIVSLVFSAVFLLQQKASWALNATQIQLIVGASLINSAACLVLFRYLARADAAKVGSALATMFIVQVAAAAFFAMALARTPLTASKVVGVVFAALAVFLINR